MLPRVRGSPVEMGAGKSPQEAAGGNPRVLRADGGGNQRVFGADSGSNLWIRAASDKDFGSDVKGGSAYQRGLRTAPGGGGGGGSPFEMGAGTAAQEPGGGNPWIRAASDKDFGSEVKDGCADQGWLLTDPAGGGGGANLSMSDGDLERDNPCSVASATTQDLPDATLKENGIYIILRGPSTPSKDKILKTLREIGGSIDDSIKETEIVRISIRDKQVETAMESFISNHENQVRRKIFNEEMEFERIFREHHELFLCRLDLSHHICLLEYCDKMRKCIVVRKVTPGAGIEASKNKSTHQDLKLVILRIYLLIKSLHRIGHSLAGNFNALNFVIDHSKGQINVRFAHLNHGSLRNTNPKDEDQDMERFKEMIYWEVFTDKAIPPHDISYWLSLLGDKELEDLLPIHMALMEDQDAVNRLMSLYDAFKEMKSGVYDEILKSLASYNDWRDVIAAGKGNYYVTRTIQHINHYTKTLTTYADDAGGLLHLLRNCKNHEGRPLLQDFIRVVSDEFPNLLYDFQREMFQRGYKS